MTGAGMDNGEYSPPLNESPSEKEGKYRAT